MKKNLFLVFCFSFIPGAGQMYQEYMKRGISIMTIFAIFVALLSIVGTPVFAIPLPIIYAYSFFDTYRIRNSIDSKDKIKDGYIWSNTQFDIFDDKLKAMKKNSFLGWILVIIGIYLMFTGVIEPVLTKLDIEALNLFVNIVSRYFPAVIISIVSILFGIKFISNK